MEALTGDNLDGAPLLPPRGVSGPEPLPWRPIQMRKLAPISLGLLLIAAIAVLVLTRSGGPPAPMRVSRILTVRAGARGEAIPAGFLGLSMEYPTLERYAGTDPGAPDPVFVQLVRNLSPGQRPVLRVGGVSTDHAWSPIAGVPAPPWARYTFDPTLLGVTRAVAATLGAKLILGINLEADSGQIAAGEATALLGALGRSSIYALELGNEPELWAGFPWYRTPAGIRVRGRAAGWSPALHARQFATVAGALPDLPLAGPAAGSVKWSAQLGPFLAANPRVAVATLHAYPLKRCRATTHVSGAQLLDESSSTGLAALLAPYVRTARAAGVPLRIGELNSISCGGEAGVSDSFASALWSLDALFSRARVGIAGVHVHTTPQIPNQLFAFTRGGGRWSARVYPIYYGLLAFARATPPGARLIPIAGGARSPLRAWATRGPDGRIRVVLINARESGATAIGVRVPRARRALLERLTAPGLAAGGGVTLGGQGFGAATGTGLPAGPRRVRVLGAQAGAFRLRVPAGSAALLTF